MAKENLAQIVSLFQDFDQQITDFEAQLAAAHYSTRQLRLSLQDIMLKVAQEYRSLLKR